MYPTLKLIPKDINSKVSSFKTYLKGGEKNPVSIDSHKITQAIYHA